MAINPIPVSAAQALGAKYGFDQVIIIARKVGYDPEPHGESVTTWGKDPEHCDAAARIGGFLMAKIMRWPEEIKALVNRFLMWPLPKTLVSDACVVMPDYQFPRSGTNLLNYEEARQMIEYLLRTE